MNPVPPPNPLSAVTASLEQQLSDAKKEKTIAQVPALRRLYYVTRVFSVLGMLGCILVIVTAGPAVYAIVNEVQARDLGVVSWICALGYAAAMWLSVALSFYVLTAYRRFTTQFRDNHVHQIADTVPVPVAVFKYSLGLLVVNIFLIGGIYQNAEALLGATLTLLPSLIVTGVFFLVMRHYVTTAQAELPTLIAAAGPNAPSGNYRPMRSVFMICLGIAAIVVVLGYLVAGA